MSQQAITATELKDAVATQAGLNLPAGFTDSMLDRIAQQKTAVVLHLRGLEALPAAGTVERDLLDNAVTILASSEVRRRLRPDDEEFLKALNAEESSVKKDLAIVHDSSNQVHRHIRIIGGVED